MLASALLSLREGLEAALIIGIVLGALLKLRRPDLNRTVWNGAGLAALGSLLVAYLLNLLGMEFSGRGEQIFEGATMLLAAGVLTWMIFWMQRSAGKRKKQIEAQAANAVQGTGKKTLFSLAFLAVFREGVELALFLFAIRQTTSPTNALIGTALGLTAAGILGWMLFHSSRKLNLPNFFRVTNILLIVFAAGLVAHGIHEFNEAGVIPAVIEHVWNINHILNEKSELGLILKALFGYNGNPSLTEVIGYLLYVGGIAGYLTSTNRPSKRRQLAPAGD